MQPLFRISLVTLALVALPVALIGQVGLTLPPSGDNQQASVTQHMGLVSVTVAYSSPDVDGRVGKIWGQLVPFGLTNLGFGSGRPSPWRAGANENTVFTVSHDVEVEGQPLAAGSYGLHMIPGEDTWIVIFSRNSTAWGSFFYDESLDALRVEVRARETDYNEWLTFEFIDRRPDRTTLALRWEYLEVPIAISVPRIEDLYVARLSLELESTAGFVWQSYVAAADYAMQFDRHLSQALIWADQAIGMPFVGQENFTTLQTRAQVLERLQRTDEATQTMWRAVSHPSATVMQIHAYGRELIGKDRFDEALEVFKLNARRYPNTWPTDWGLARAYSALGDFKRALRHAQIARDRAPDELNRQNIAQGIEALREGRGIN